jgi:hypothetical protein
MPNFIRTFLSKSIFDEVKCSRYVFYLLLSSNDNLMAIMNVNTLGGGFAVEAAAVERTPCLSPCEHA